MKVVSNSSPLCYLRLIDCIHILPALFGQILVPEVVFLELSHEQAPEMVRKWTRMPPSWLRVERVVADLDPALLRLHAGERDAIALARQLHADLILVDEKAAREISRQLGLNVTGLLGIIDEAATRGLLNLLDAIEHLQQTNFRASPHLLKAILRKHYHT